MESNFFENDICARTQKTANQNAVSYKYSDLIELLLSTIMKITLHIVMAIMPALGGIKT